LGRNSLDTQFPFSYIHLTQKRVFIHREIMVPPLSDRDEANGGKIFAFFYSGISDPVLFGLKGILAGEVQPADPPYIFPLNLAKIP
jgi:hypothetical protein